MKSCLVVDDSRVIRKLARGIVESLDFDVSEAVDGLDALDVCTADLPDAILLDWNMPNMDGLEFLSALRQLPDGDQPVVIFCTTVNELERITEAINTGANEYIMKPFDTEIVRSKFEQVGLL